MHVAFDVPLRGWNLVLIANRSNMCIIQDFISVFGFFSESPFTRETRHVSRKLFVKIAHNYNTVVLRDLVEQIGQWCQRFWLSWVTPRSVGSIYSDHENVDNRSFDPDVRYPLASYLILKRALNIYWKMVTLLTSLFCLLSRYIYLFVRWLCIYVCIFLFTEDRGVKIIHTISIFLSSN